MCAPKNPQKQQQQNQCVHYFSVILGHQERSCLSDVYPCYAFTRKAPPPTLDLSFSLSLPGPYSSFRTHPLLSHKAFPRLTLVQFTPLTFS